VTCSACSSARASLPHGSVIGDNIGAFGAYLSTTRRFVAAPSKEKQLEVLKGWSHSDLYDKLEPVGQARRSDPFFKKHLGSAQGKCGCLKNIATE